MFEVALDAGLQRKGVAVVAAGNVVLASHLIVKNGSRCGLLIERNAADGQALRIVRRVGLGDGRVRDADLSEPFLNALDGLVGRGVDRILDHDLQDQVRTAAKIEAEMDVLLDSGKDALLDRKSTRLNS